MEAKKTVRCAIYTRLAAPGPDGAARLEEQRSLSEAYIAAHAVDGLVVLPERYDDGWQSGLAADRPALNRLRRDVEASKVDCVVVDQYCRLARDEVIHDELRTFFRRHGVKVLVLALVGLPPLPIKW